MDSKPINSTAPVEPNIDSVLSALRTSKLRKGKSRKVIVLLAGKKQSGKNTLANYIAADFLNRMSGTGHDPYSVNSAGELEYCSIAPDQSVNRESISIETGVASEEEIGVGRIRSLAFATPLKQFCIDVLGLSKKQCYGTEQEKMTITHIKWDGLPLDVRFRYRKKWYHWLRSGFMTAREVMQVFGTDIIRRFYPNAWAEAGFRFAVNSNELVVEITDSRFLNEVQTGHQFAEAGDEPPEVLMIRLSRDPNAHIPDRHLSETSIDLVPNSLFDIVIPADVDAEKAFELVRPLLDLKYEAAGTFN